jgi:hypothetical protein
VSKVRMGVDEAGFNIPKKRNYARIKHYLCKRIRL